MPSQILYFSLPRSGCHMLERMLFSEQPTLKKCWHPFAEGPQSGKDHGMVGEELIKWLQQENPSIEGDAGLVREAAKGIKSWQQTLDEKKDDEIVYMHEHAMYLFKPSEFLRVIKPPSPGPILNVSENPTQVPPSLLLHPGTLPILTIRNPLLTIPSTYLANTILHGPMSRPNALVASHIGWNRYLYDLFTAHNITPIIADADDYMSSEDFVRSLAYRLSFDAEKVVVQWEPVKKEEMHPKLYRIQKTLVESTGLEKGRVRRKLVLEEEVEKWRGQVTEEVVELWKELVAIEMPHYEYLWERRFRG